MFDQTNQFGLEVVINNRPAWEYPHTDGYTYLEGRSGSNYELKLVNNSHERVLFIPSVDGLNVLNGKADWEDGYVVAPFSHTVVPGWRRDNSVAAGFVFADAKDSYTNRMGNSASNVGVIGAMVFREKPILSFSSLSYPTVFGSPVGTGQGVLRSVAQNSIQASEVKSAELGTGWGQDTTFNTVEAQFEKRDANYPDAIMALYYDSAKGLERRGINLRNTGSNPNPFPGYASSTGCEPPPGIIKRPYPGRRGV